MSFAGAFNSLLFMHRRPLKLLRSVKNLPGVEYDIQGTPSNYFRNLEASGDVVSRGREFVISKDNLKSAGIPGPLKRGDYLTDPELGGMSIVEVREMFDFGGAIIGYRVRCE